jgi:hypothetical protein
MPKLREFYIDEAYLTDVVVHKTWNIYTKDGHEPTQEELLKVLAGKGKCSMTYSEDHPNFAKLRNELEQLGYIRTCRNIWNGDMVLKSFKLNGYIARKNWRFSCAVALGGHFNFLRKHPKYDNGYLN